MFNVLVIEDDKNIRRLIAECLKDQGYFVSEAADGLEGWIRFRREHFDLVVVDVMMPEINGFVLCRKIRGTDREIPILMLTARGALDDKKEGFVSGADDYMVKPFDMDEMALRIKALLRRSKNISEKIVKVLNVELNFYNSTLKWDGGAIEMPNKEFRLLFKFMMIPDRIFTRMQLLDEIWGSDDESNDRTVDVHIRRIREKIMGVVRGFEIVTVRGLGYKGVFKE